MINETLTQGVIIETLIVATANNSDLVELSIESGGSWFVAKSEDLLAIMEAYLDISNIEDGDLKRKNFEVRDLKEQDSLIDCHNFYTIFNQLD